MDIWQEDSNVGTRIESYSQACGLMIRIPPEPNLVYIFRSAENAQKALLDLPFIFLASDSGKMISTEIVGFGFYEVGKNLFQAIIVGKGLTYDLWKLAKKSFIDNDGSFYSETEVPQSSPTISPDSDNTLTTNDVVFIKEYEEFDDRGGKINLVKYVIYRADNKYQALKWLSQNKVSKNFYYLIIETPEGNFGRDIQGIYQE